jgi:hypothetical protein
VSKESKALMPITMIIKKVKYFLMSLLVTRADDVNFAPVVVVGRSRRVSYGDVSWEMSSVYSRSWVFISNGARP